MLFATTREVPSSYRPIFKFNKEVIGGQYSKQYPRFHVSVLVLVASSAMSLLRFTMTIPITITNSISPRTIP